MKCSWDMEAQPPLPKGCFLLSVPHLKSNSIILTIALL